MCFQMDFQLLSGLFVAIWGDLRKDRNRPILSKKPGLWPMVMVLNMADLGKSWESFQTP